MAAPPRSGAPSLRHPFRRSHAPAAGGTRLRAGGLILVEERRAEEQNRRDHEVRQEPGDRDRRLACPAEQEEEDRLAQEDDDDERREAAERVYVIGARQLEGSTDRRTKPASVDEHHRHGEPDEREPGEGRQNQQEG